MGADDLGAATGVAGRVTGAADGEPLAGAAVEALALEPPRPSALLAAMTNEDGRYLWELEPGTWEIRVSAAGHAPAASVVSVRSGEVVTADFALSPGV